MVHISKLFCYNPNITHKEGQEHKNILHYWPPETDIDRQCKDVGLAGCLVGFSSNFSPDQPCEVLHTTKTQQAFFSPEEDFWFLICVPKPEKDEEDIRVLHHHILVSVLKKLCRHFEWLYGRLSDLLKKSSDDLKQLLADFFAIYIPTINNLSGADIFDCIDGIQFLPVDRLSFLRTQSFANKVEAKFPDEVLGSTVLVDDFLLYSSVNQASTRCVFTFLTKRKTRRSGATQKAENLIYLSYQPLQGEVGFLTMDNGGKTPVVIKVFIGSSDQTDRDTWDTFNALQQPSNEPTPEGAGSFSKGDVNKGDSEPTKGKEELMEVALVVYQYQSALFAFYCQMEAAGSTAFLDQLGDFIKKEIGETVTSVRETICRPAGMDEAFCYIYFNRMNLALKSSIRKPGHLVSSPSASSNWNAVDLLDALHFIEVMHGDFKLNSSLKEVVTKSKRNDQWIAGRRSGSREFYVIFNEKPGLVEVNEEVKRIGQIFFNNIFVD